MGNLAHMPFTFMCINPCSIAVDWSKFNIINGESSDFSWATTIYGDKLLTKRGNSIGNPSSSPLCNAKSTTKKPVLAGLLPNSQELVNMCLSFLTFMCCYGRQISCNFYLYPIWFSPSLSLHIWFCEDLEIHLYFPYNSLILNKLIYKFLLLPIYFLNRCNIY